MCKDEGKITPATVVDHIVPHRGCEVRFFDYENTQSLCKAHHDSAKQFAERRGFSKAVGVDGVPLDPLHPANRSA